MSLNQSSMDIVNLSHNESRKRRRGFTKRKLFVNEKVEVKSVEEGFLGSWHPGMVIRCGRQKRHVRYDHILIDDETTYLVEVVNVSTVLDGVSSSDFRSVAGHIRPLPPPVAFGKSDLPFGLCVDVNYQDAWWEGVLFDHRNGVEERNVFFPDLGDEMKIVTHQLRITQDWEEDTGHWEMRGKWAFLDAIEECEKVSYIPISVKQIWYDVRASKAFENLRHWTCDVREFWRHLISEVVGDYYTLTLEEVFPALNLPNDFSKETPELESAEPDNNVHPDTSHGVTDVEVSDNRLLDNGGVSNLLDSNTECRSIIPAQDKDPLVEGASEKGIVLREEPVSPVQTVMPDDRALIPHSGSCSRNNRKRRSSTSVRWQPVVLTDVESHPDVVNQYFLGCGSKTVRERLKLDLRKHLAYHGWTIEVTENKSLPRTRYRYKSPNPQDPKFYTSLVQVLELAQREANIDHSRVHSTNGNNLALLSDQPHNDQNLVVSPPNGTPPDAIEPEYCPMAVVKYYMTSSNNNSVDKRKWKQKAQKHLLAEGWILHCPNRRRTTMYQSPLNQCFGSLRDACVTYIKEKIDQWTTSGMIPLNAPSANEESVGHVDSDLLRRLSQLLQKEPESESTSAESIDGNSRRKIKPSMPRRGRKRAPTRVLRSSKRVQEVSAPSPLHQRPQNVLSWLVEIKMVSLKCKVFYRAKGGMNTDVAEGRITRDGIKCSCCHRVYSIGGFANHARGSDDCRPSSNIYLKDGRSLLDCIIHAMYDHRRTRETIEKSNNTFNGENDNVCSVCQYGGDLILCDQCPSAFHRNCIGLENVPDGDWFCPSCRCWICGQLEGTELGLFLTCIQCEHKYHAGCMEDREINGSTTDMNNWMCGEECEQIHASLQSLLGKPFTVGGGANVLTWTLLKCNSLDFANYTSVETFGRLSVALSVMHECFEPLMNPFSKRDIVDDVIFNIRSKLSRLNFQGFYTILLERDEELISAANIRVFGKKVAEVPLVGTRLQYRRLGMCRILMDELEKKLKDLGIERLVLPAVPAVLETWMNCFGFEKMTNSVRSQFVDCAFLDFQGTVMCQKLLTGSPSPESAITRETQPNLRDVFSVKCRIDFVDKSSSVSEVDQVEEIEKS